MEHHRPIPHGSKTIVSSALIDLGTLASKAMSRMWRMDPAADTEAAAWLRADPGHGFEMMKVSLMAATDHYHAFARLLRHEEIFVMSLAAVLRAFGEAAGRAWWLMDCDSPEQFARRAATLHHMELRETTGFQLASRGADGRAIPLVDPLLDAERAISTVAAAQPGVRSERLPDFATLFTTVSNACGVDGKGATYRELSVATHGSSLSVAGMSNVGPQEADGSAMVSLALSIGRAEKYSWTLARIIEGAIRRLAGIYGDQAELDRLDATISRVNETCVGVFTFLHEA